MFVRILQNKQHGLGLMNEAKEVVESINLTNKKKTKNK